jgi:hypothetical protein
MMRLGDQMATAYGEGARFDIEYAKLMRSTLETLGPARFDPRFFARLAPAVKAVSDTRTALRDLNHKEEEAVSHLRSQIALRQRQDDPTGFVDDQMRAHNMLSTSDRFAARADKLSAPAGASK